MIQSITYLNTDQIDKEKALLLVDASIQAYNAYNKLQGPVSVCNSDRIKSPTGYEHIASWKGVDAVFNEDKTVEYYGLVFRSENAPYTYIFSFRGTDSTEDLLDDFGYDPTEFFPYDKSASVPSDVRVESGFYRIYSDDDPATNTDSMQKQLFTLIDQYHNSDKPIDQLYITGHSLGAALTALFTLDMALSRPNINTSNYNYASPRVGNQAFVEFYEQQLPQKDEKTRTIRIQNTRDKVPCVPLRDQRYQHLSYAYLIDFHKDAWFGFDLNFVADNHDIHSYQKVLECAFESETGVCINHHLLVTSHYFTMKKGNLTRKTKKQKVNSQQPNPSQVCGWW
ncbi:MAG: lipase family protein [Crocosphaera sp.]